MKKIKTVLISVFNKDGLDKICPKLHKNKIQIISTGGTKKYIENLGIPVISVESVTDYPSILGGRVKTLHPKIFGALLSRAESKSDFSDIRKYQIPKIDMVIVDLYPFKETVNSSDNENEIIEKIDIGGVSLVRAGAKNFSDVLVVSSRKQYHSVLNHIIDNDFSSDIAYRKKLASKAFKLILEYDRDIDEFFGLNANIYKSLRYGENPHQKGIFKGDIDDVFEKVNGKELSYNNLLDIDSAIRLIAEFNDTTFAIIKHNNECGVASSSNVHASYQLALEADPLSAFGGVLVTNKKIDYKSSLEINKLFFEILIAPEFDKKAIDVLVSKKNRIILLQKKSIDRDSSFRNILNGVLQQETDTIENNSDNWEVVTENKAESNEIEDLKFANKIVKHSKSNAIVLVKNKQMISSGVGQTSRVDALKFAIDKAKVFKLDVRNSAMASDAFFPFPDCIEIASRAGISSVVQPGGSIKDNLSVDACNDKGMSMYLSGIRHFYH